MRAAAWNRRCATTNRSSRCSATTGRKSTKASARTPKKTLQPEGSLFVELHLEHHLDEDAFFTQKTRSNYHL